MKVLITGFDPFGGEKINPAYEAVKAMNNIDGIEVIKLEVPTIKDASSNKLIEAIKEHKPNVVILVGQAGGRASITPERVAINVDDYSIKDNAGNQPVDISIANDGPVGYFSTLPIKNIVKNIQSLNIKASVSNSAGTFVCNHLMYSVLHYIDSNNLNIKAGFIHVPYIKEQVEDKPNMPFMLLEDISKALAEAVRTSCTKQEEVKESMGAIC